MSHRLAIVPHVLRLNLQLGVALLLQPPPLLAAPRPIAILVVVIAIAITVIVIVTPAVVGTIVKANRSLIAIVIMICSVVLDHYAFDAKPRPALLC